MIFTPSDVRSKLVNTEAAMNAVAVYVNTAKLVLQSTECVAIAASSNSLSSPAVASTVSSNVQQLCHMLPNLRQLLSCVVCCRLVHDPLIPKHGRCVHNVCRLCVHGQKSLHPVCEFCENCQSFKAYDENKQIRSLLPCYKSLCEHLKASVLFSQLAGKKFHQNSILANGILLPYVTLQDIIIEGIGYDRDDDISNSCGADQPKAVTVKGNTQISSQQSLLACNREITPIESVEPRINYSIVKQSSPQSYTPPASTYAEINTSVTDAITKVKREVLSPTTIQQQRVSLIQTKQERCPSEESTSPIRTPTPITNINQSSILQLNQVKNTSTITYLGTHKRGIIVPIVSSSATTSAPLSIASARLQSLNRQLAQARVLNVVSTSNSCIPKAQATDCKAATSPFTVTMPSATPILKTSVLTSSTNTVTSTAMKAPSIKTVSNGSVMYSVLYTGIGNKITIKRKTEANDDPNPKKKSPATAQHSSRSTNIKNNSSKRRGCRCGNATPTPGKLTCCGQRCPCYVDSKSCIACKCRGCRNPHRPDGGKVRAAIPELDCYEIEMDDEHSNLSVSDLPIANIKTKTPKNPMNNNISTTMNHLPINHLFPNLANDALTPLHSYCNNSGHGMTTSALSPSTASISFNNSNTLATQAASLNQNIANNILQFNQLSRESLVIQNAEGKYQVLNLFSTTSPNQNSQLSVLQRISHLTHAAASGSNSYVLPASTTIVSHSDTPQIVTQSKSYPNMQQQHPNAGLTFHNNHHQQPYKPNIITVHAINAPASNTTSTTSMTLSSCSSSTPTITLSPIVVNNANGYSSTAIPSPNQNAFNNSGDMHIQANNLISLPVVNQSVGQVLNRPLTVTTSARSLMKFLETKNI